MRRAFVVTSGLVLAVVLVQLYLAGVGAFSRPATTDAWTAHRAGATVLVAAALINIAVAALARAGGRVVALAALPVGLVVLQVVLIVVGDALGGTDDERGGLPLHVVALHALNALVVLGTAVSGLRIARRLAAEEASGRVARPGRVHAP